MSHFGYPLLEYNHTSVYKDDLKEILIKNPEYTVMSNVELILHLYKENQKLKTMLANGLGDISWAYDD